MTEKVCCLQTLKYLLFRPLQKELPYLWPNLLYQKMTLPQKSGNLERCNVPQKTRALD